MKTPAPRLFVVPAMGCDKALILRRGPTDHVATLIWDRATDDIEMGQWLKGRIYEHRCDISPDALHMIVFARRTRADLAWTALSRAPWLAALAYYPQTDTWHGGGAFDARGRMWLNGASPPEVPLPGGLRAADVDAFPHATDGFHMGDLFAAKMALRGWEHCAGTRYDLVLTKSADHGWQVEHSIEIAAKDRALISNRFALVRGETRIDQQDWEWADTFGNTIQFAARGALWRTDLTASGKLENEQLIHDFSDMRFEEIIAPYDGVSER